MKNILYIENDCLDPYFNFGLEYYLTSEKCFEENTVLLFWRTFPTLMVGKYQNTYEEIDMDYAEENNINIVRRMSGGGTIYTDPGGWQYSFITKSDKDKISFDEYMEPIIELLKSLGINAEFNGRNDLVIGGRKFSGTAQYKHNGYTVHHGSLLYDTDLEKMARSTTVDEYKMSSKGIKSVRERVTNISEHMKDPVGINEFKNTAVAQLLGDTGEEYRLSSYDIERIKFLAKEKFDNWDSKFGKNPSFNVVKTGHFEGGNVELKLYVEKGIIKDAGIYGDFFANVNRKKICNIFNGCVYEKNSLKKRLNDNNFDEYVYRITADQIAEMI